MPTEKPKPEDGSEKAYISRSELSDRVDPNSREASREPTFLELIKRLGSDYAGHFVRRMVSYRPANGSTPKYD